MNNNFLDFKNSFNIPFFEEGLSAGFPSPADDDAQRTLDLHELLIKHPAATFFVRVKGESMEGAGIFSGDLLIVDRALQPSHGAVVVALLDGAFVVKRLVYAAEKRFLKSEHPHYPPIEIGPERDFQLWGIVTYVIHRPR